MTMLDSLPGRPLSPAEFDAVNDADAVELAVPVGEEGSVDGLVVATDEWVRGLAFDADAGGWTAVTRESIDGRSRFEALQACEEAVRARLGRPLEEA